MAGEAGGEAKAIAIMKKGAGLLLGGNRPEGDTTHHVAENLSIEMSATTQSSPLSATSVNPSAEAKIASAPHMRAGSGGLLRRQPAGLAKHICGLAWSIRSGAGDKARDRRLADLHHHGRDGIRGRLD
jgi:hypothetical protein